MRKTHLYYLPDKCQKPYCLLLLLLLNWKRLKLLLHEFILQVKVLRACILTSFLSLQLHLQTPIMSSFSNSIKPVHSYYWTNKHSEMVLFRGFWHRFPLYHLPNPWILHYPMEALLRMLISTDASIYSCLNHFLSEAYEGNNSMLHHRAVKVNSSNVSQTRPNVILARIFVLYFWQFVKG